MATIEWEFPTCHTKVEVDADGDFDQETLVTTTGTFTIIKVNGSEVHRC